MWPNPHFPTDLVTFIEEILNGKLHFLCSVRYGRVLTLFLQEKRDNLPLPLMSCESWMFMKENPNRKKSNIKRTFSDQIYKSLVETIPHCSLIKERSANAQYRTVTLSGWQKQPPEVFHKKLFVKIVQYPQESKYVAVSFS